MKKIISNKSNINKITNNIDDLLLNFIKSEIESKKVNFNTFIYNKIFIDFGNSNAKIYINHQLYSIGYSNFENEFFEVIYKELEFDKVKKTNNIEIYYSNVKNYNLEKVDKYIIQQIKINLIFVNIRTIIDSEKVKNSIVYPFDYSKVRVIGTDRLLGLYLAGLYSQKQCAITIDFGTAITINIIDKNGNVLGGQILPGLFLQVNSLNLNTAGIKLENVDIFDFLDKRLNYKIDSKSELSIIGTYTQEAVLNGIYSGIIGVISNFIFNDEIKKLKPNSIIFTGSYSEYFYKYFAQISQNSNSQLNLFPNLYHSNLLNLYSIILISKLY